MQKVVASNSRKKLRVLVDIAHPAHIHFFKNIVSELEKRGHEILIVARQKDVTLLLLDHLGHEYETAGGQLSSSRRGQLVELIRRVHYICQVGRRFRPNLILTRNPSGVQAARLLRTVGIFDTDDGSAAGIHFASAAPFATFITSPDCILEDYGSKHIKYPGYKQSTYLHPDVFTPDSTVLDELSLRENEPFYLLRFVSMTASHDKGEQGIGYDLKASIIQELQSHGKVFISSEAPLPERWRDLYFPLPPHRMHDAIAFAALLVGDSQSMAAEAAMLGTPNIRMSSFVGRISYLEELERRYQLTFGFYPRQKDAFLNKMRSLVTDPQAREAAHQGRNLLLSEKKNIVHWYVNFIENL
jgi:predicted glycosyltransferase